MNKVIVIGRCTKEIELKQLSSGSSVVEFSVAVKRPFKSANGEYESDFFDCVAFKNTAELISKYVKRGDMIGIEGRLQTRNYTNREGKKVYVTETIVENVEFLQGKRQEEQKLSDEGVKFEEIDPFSNSVPLPF